MKSVLEEYVWNEADDTVVFETEGVEKRLTLQPNMILTRMCELDTGKYLVGRMEEAGEEELTEELSRLRIQLSIKRLDNPLQVRVVRRDLARVKTIITEKTAAEDGAQEG